MSAAQKNPLTSVAPKCVFVRFSGYDSAPDEATDREYRQLVYIVLRTMNVDRNSLTKDGRRRVEIVYNATTKTVDFSFFYSRPTWAQQALAVATRVSEMYTNCKVTLEAV